MLWASRGTRGPAGVLWRRLFVASLGGDAQLRAANGVGRSGSVLLRVLPACAAEPLGSIGIVCSLFKQHPAWHLQHQRVRAEEGRHHPSRRAEAAADLRLEGPIARG